MAHHIIMNNFPTWQMGLAAAKGESTRHPKNDDLLTRTDLLKVHLVICEKKKTNESAQHPKNDDLLTRTDLL